MTTTQHTTNPIVSKYEKVSIDELIERLQDLKENLQALNASDSYVNIDSTYDIDGICQINLICTYRMEETPEEKEGRELKQKQLMEEIQKQRKQIQIQELKDRFMDGVISATEYERKMEILK